MATVADTTILMADFETRAGELAEQENKTWVWGWTCCNIFDIENVFSGSSINSFFAFLRKCGDCICYFHNLKFDGKFILDYLLKNDYVWCADRKEFKSHNKKGFMTLIDDSGVFYSITIHNGYRLKVEFRDSMKKLPFSVDVIAKSFKTKYKKLSLDYVLDRPVGYTPDPEELEYMKNDVRIVAEVLQFLYNGGFDKMTIGSDALTHYKDINPSQFKHFFPQLTKEEDSFIRKAYRGGWCYVNPKYSARVLHELGNTYDVNSLYPSMMSSVPYEMHGKMTVNRYPCFTGIYYKGEYIPDDTYPLYVCHIRAGFVVKDGYLPTIQLKNNFMFVANEYITDSNGVQELYLTSVDYELFCEHYEIYSIEFIDGYKYGYCTGIFDSYINTFMEIKKKSKGAERSQAKLMLNNLYGKFAQSVEVGSKSPLIEDGANKVSYHFEPVQERKGVYIPVGCFVTAYSRRFTIYHAQQNYEKFCYADTDSIHLIGDAKGLKVHPTELCCWAWESQWNSAKFLRQKTYMEHVVKVDGEECDPHWDIKCAGMPQNVKDVFLDEIAKGTKVVDDFAVGLHYDNIKLRPVTVDGGVLLKTTPFEIRG